jgi:hypothetical protein
LRAIDEKWKRGMNCSLFRTFFANLRKNITLHKNSSAMPQISAFLGIVITMYYNDHNPPHFHAEYNGKSAEILIRPASIRSGALPNRVLGLVIEWTQLHEPELLANWDLLRQRKPLLNIPGLDQ